jgi:hypothetical protein
VVDHLADVVGGALNDGVENVRGNLLAFLETHTHHGRLKYNSEKINGRVAKKIICCTYFFSVLSKWKNNISRFLKF